MPNPYSEPFVIQTYYRLVQAFRDAGFEPDYGRCVVYACRATFDATTTLSYDAAANKHVAGLRAELGLDQPPPPPPPPPPGVLPRLVARDGRLWQNDRPFSWRGVTAFKLLHHFVHDVPAGIRYLDWCQNNRVTILRVAAMCQHMFQLAPFEARLALPTFLAEAAQRGLYVEVVGLLDTLSYPGESLGEHIRQLNELALVHPNMLLEVANEPHHSTQNGRLTPALLSVYVGAYPNVVPTALGAPLDSDDGNDEYARPGASTYFTIHSERADGEDGWRWVRHTKEIRDMAAQLRKFGVNDEPRRDDLRTDRHFGLGALCRICDIGDAFHYADGRWALPPAGDELGAFEARQQGWDAIPADFHGQFFNAGWAGSPVPSAQGALRRYSAVQGTVAYVISLDRATTVIPAPGWRIVESVSVGRAELNRMERA